MGKTFCADLSDAHHVHAVVELLNEYAYDDAGGAVHLSERVKNDLVAALRDWQGAHVVLAFVDGAPAGMVICFEGASFFLRKPLLRVRDLIVARPYRGRGLSKCMLAKTAEIAIRAGGFKLKLAVHEGSIQSLRICGIRT